MTTKTQKRLIAAAPDLFGEDWISMCDRMPAATEREVSREIRACLEGLLFAARLDIFRAGTQLTDGTLVYLMTEHSRRPQGIHAGVPDLLLARVGAWGWKGIELKGRNKNGLPTGHLEAEQWTAVVSGLYEVAWCAAHVHTIVRRLDGLL